MEPFRLKYQVKHVCVRQDCVCFPVGTFLSEALAVDFGVCVCVCNFTVPISFPPFTVSEMRERSVGTGPIRIEDISMLMTSEHSAREQTRDQSNFHLLNASLFHVRSFDCWN